MVQEDVQCFATEGPQCCWLTVEVLGSEAAQEEHFLHNGLLQSHLALFFFGGGV